MERGRGRAAFFRSASGGMTYVAAMRVFPAGVATALAALVPQRTADCGEPPESAARESIAPLRLSLDAGQGVRIAAPFSRPSSTARREFAKLATASPPRLSRPDRLDRRRTSRRFDHDDQAGRSGRSARASWCGLRVGCGPFGAHRGPGHGSNRRCHESCNPNQPLRGYH